MKNRIFPALISLLLILSLLCSCQGSGQQISGGIGDGNVPPVSEAIDLYITVNDNVPYFTADEITTTAFETYSSLDPLGRCGVAYACIGTELMPTEERDFSLSSVSPSGWMYNGTSNNNVYPTDVVPGGYIYNRCHLIGYQLTAETTTKENLITGTKYFNINGMFPFENMVADYIKETGNHVMYRVTPSYEGYNLLCSGVLIEAYSVEDEGDGISFCVFIYNVQPGVEIDYYTGENRLESSDESEKIEITCDYIINTDSKKVHLSTCSTGQKLSGAHRADFTGTLSELYELYPAYTQCGICRAFEADK